MALYKNQVTATGENADQGIVEVFRRDGGYFLGVRPDDGSPGAFVVVSKDEAVAIATMLTDHL